MADMVPEARPAALGVNVRFRPILLKTPSAQLRRRREEKSTSQNGPQSTIGSRLRVRRPSNFD